MTYRLLPLSLLAVPELTSRHNLDVSRLLFDLKRCGALMGRFTGCLDADAIAHCITEGLIEQFDCAFTRIWLVESDRQSLRLVASSGLYTRLDGSFAQVPMGSFKVGKIAQHCIPFLSNALPDEKWVKDRDWALENKIQGFAGLPLMAKGEAIGVLAVFSHTAMAPEFLEVLQMLSLSVSGALASALNHQAIVHMGGISEHQGPLQTETLSEKLATLLGGQKLSLIGREQQICTPVSNLLVAVAKSLIQLSCQYCRLVYEADRVVLEAMLAAALETPDDATDLENTFSDLVIEANRLGGTFQVRANTKKTVVKVFVELPQQVSAAEAVSPLSEREQQVMGLLSEGLRDREISEKLFISERTVKFHAKNIMSKLAVKTRVQAVFKATKQGWL